MASSLPEYNWEIKLKGGKYVASLLVPPYVFRRKIGKKIGLVSSFCCTTWYMSGRNHSSVPFVTMALLWNKIPIFYNSNVEEVEGSSNSKLAISFHFLCWNRRLQQYLLITPWKSSFQAYCQIEKTQTHVAYSNKIV